MYAIHTTGLESSHFTLRSLDASIMECGTMSTSTQRLLIGHDSQRDNKHISWVLWPNRSSSLTNTYGIQHNVAPWYPRKSFRRLSYTDPDYYGRCRIQYAAWRILCLPVTLEGEFSSLKSKKSSSEKVSKQPIDNDQLKALLADSERAKLIKKLSEANQQNRFLKRQLHVKEEDFLNFKRELAVIEHEIQALVKMAKEIANYGIQKGSRRINGKYVQSHLVSRLEVVQAKLEEQIKDVGHAQSKEVPLFWSGMAESVQVMGSFDGWSEGEHLSPEYTGFHTSFSTSIMLRPGRYEIKFLVDGEWRLSTEYPTIGEGVLENNLLIVE